MNCRGKIHSYHPLFISLTNTLCAPQNSPLRSHIEHIVHIVDIETLARRTENTPPTPTVINVGESVLTSTKERERAVLPLRIDNVPIVNDFIETTNASIQSSDRCHRNNNQTLLFSLLIFQSLLRS